MKMVNTNSLAATLDAVNEAFFYGRPIPRAQRDQCAKWIASRQGKAGSYADMFAPTRRDFKAGARLFTGELIRTGAASSHILGEEACRALILLDVSAVTVREALQRASLGMMARLDQSGREGMYCCGKCSVSLWRHLSAGGLDKAEKRLAAGIRSLKLHRDGQGRWRRFPFYYTLLALSEIKQPAAVREMRYAAPVLERFLKRSRKVDKVSQRRRLLAERILEKC
jgi:hypothetical protein